MKKLIYKILGEEKKEGYIDYKDLLKHIMRSPMDPKSGIDPDEIDKSLRVMEYIEDSDDKELILEDADYSYMESKVTAFRWGYIHKNFKEFLDNVKHPEAFKRDKDESKKVVS